MTSAPVGTVTLVFTDIEGSTQLLHALGQHYATVLADHHRLLGEAFRAQDGTEQGTAGDGLYFIFPTARAALVAAIEAQRKLAAHTWPSGANVRVRMGVHTGEPARAATGYVGIDVHRAARIGAVGHGGQILVSQTTRDLAAAEVAPDITFIDLGAHRLKDLPEQEHLFQVVTAGIGTDFPALRTVETWPGNLPRQLTTFVGRERELVEGQRLLHAAPLVTLTGPGGVGKTRLAVRLAGEAIADFDDGAWLIELGSVTEAAFVPTTVANALGVVERPGRSPLDALTDHLRYRRLLLVLDNCEHLLAASAGLAHAVLLACPGVRMLATSQEALGIDGEALLPVPSLALPEAGRTTPASLLTCESVLLFLERAQSAAPGFRLTEANAESVAQISRRLDGIPLALELAAARLRALSVEQIAARLDDRFRLLTGGSRVAVPRHQTLRATMDWSYELLSPDEQALLRRLSVFAGGFGLEAAEAVGTGGPVVPDDVLDLLTRLVDRSLVAAEAGGPEARFRLSEIVRQYTFERLVEAGEALEARRRHRDWYLAFIEGASTEMQRGPDAARTLDRIDVELDNVRAALEWSEAQPGEEEAGLRMAASLWRFAEIRGHAEEGRRWLERMLARTEGGEATLLRANALTGAGILASMQGDLQAAYAFHEESLEVQRRLGNATAIAYAINNLANVALQRGDLERTRELYDQGILISRQIDDRGLPFALMNQADVLARLGDHDAAQAAFDESVALCRSRGDRWGEAFALDAFGQVAARRGDLEAARSLHEEAAAISRQIGDDRGVARALTNLADQARQAGDPTRALALYRESLSLRQAMRDQPGIAAGLEKLAVMVALDDPTAAAHLLGAAEGLREAIRARTPLAMRGEMERLTGSLVDQLGGEAFDVARAVGRDLGPEGALATIPA